MTSLTQEVKIRLEEVARGRYAVLVLRLDDSCPLLEGLRDIEAAHEELFHLTWQVIGQHLPHKGPHFSRRLKVSSKKIDHWGISEFQLGGWPGAAARVLWFFDDEGEDNPTTIVLVDAFWKIGNSASGDVLLRDRVPRASSMKRLYFEKKALGQVEHYTEGDDQ